MIPFAQFMEEMLYGPTGYYASGRAQSGRSGDYFTAPDVGPIFGELLAAIFGRWRKKLDPMEFTLVEVGAGEGRLARDILQAQSSHPTDRYVAVEKSAARRERLASIEQERSKVFQVVPDLKALAQAPLDGVVFGNELVDAFPVHRVRLNNGRLEEAYVGTTPTIHWSSPSTPRLQAYFDRLGITLPDGYETEVNLIMAEWLQEASAALRRGLLVLIDYGRPAHEYYAPERDRGTLRAFSEHRVLGPSILGSDPLFGKGSDPSMPSTLDWTSDVDFTSLALDARDAGFIPLAFMEMGTFLMQGVEKIVGAALVAARDWTRAQIDSQFRAGTRPAPTGLRYLLHPEGLGTAFHVLILGKAVDPKDWVFAHNRLTRLGLDLRREEKG